MKFFYLLLSLLFVIGCSDFHNHISPNQLQTQNFVEDCRHMCNITFYPNDPDSSILPCGSVTVTYEDGYFIICLDNNISIVEYLGWNPNTLDEYYNDFWSFDIRDNCVLLQPNDDFYDTVMEEGFQLDLIICIQQTYELPTSI